MTVDNAVTIIETVITNTIEEYDQSPDSQSVDSLGVSTRIAHPLDIVDSGDILFTLDMSLKEVALKAVPISLLETTGSTASELRRVSTDYFVRVPTAPAVGQTLDVDDGLSYAVVFKTLSALWRDFGDYEQKAESIINTYIQAYRTYLADLIAGTVGAGAETYIRFSDDETNWHSSFTVGDTFISFKRIDTDTWTASAKFMGTDGTNGIDGINGTNFDDTLTYAGNAGKVVAVNTAEDGIELVAPTAGSGGATDFIGLTDTPTALVASKFVAVNTAGDALELVDAPTSSGGLTGANVFGDKVFFDDSTVGTLALDAGTNNVFYLFPNSSLELSFTPFDDDGTQVSAWWGTTYTFILVSTGSADITFNASESIFGDASVGLGTLSTSNNTTTTILKMIFTGYDWYVVSKEIHLNANG